MGKRFDEVKDLQFGCKMCEFKEMDTVINFMNDFISFPKENNLSYRIVPIDISLAVKVIPRTIGSLENGGMLTSDSYYSLLLLYEKVEATQ